MTKQTGIAAAEEADRAGGFRLMRYFMLTTLVAFSAVALALYVLQGMEEAFFEQVQREQGEFFARAQADHALRHADADRSSLLAVNEAGHVNLTHVFANRLWDADFAPFVVAAQRLPAGHCRAPGAAIPAVAASSPSAKRACTVELGRRIMALPGFAALDAKSYATMRASTVFKIKVFDLRGIVVYSSEHGQIGEDGAGNLGWQSAAGGRPASELTHRDRFSAFERVVENRDLISTYVPVRAPGRDEVLGVFEIYSDVTPFLEQIRTASKELAQLTAANDARVAQTARLNQEKVEASSDRFLAIVGGLLALLYATSLLIVRNGQRLIDRQSLAAEQAALREQHWHREKMAALATMAANVSHEVGNPLAIISGLAQDLADRAHQGEVDAGASKLILEQSTRIARMMRQIADFAAARNETPEWVDVNPALKAVCDFLGFDRRFHGLTIQFHPGDRLPACWVVPDHLNEVMMNLLQACAEAAPEQAQRGAITVETVACADGVGIRVHCDGAGLGAGATLAGLSAGGRLEAARRRVLDMGGRMATSAGLVEITLPRPPGDEAPA